jgi:hypothetical protein
MALNQQLSVSGKAGDIVQIGSVENLSLQVQNLITGFDRAPTRWDSHVQSFLEYYVGTPERPAPFGGRDDELRSLDCWLDDASEVPYLLLCAPAGLGKSALIANWVVRLGKLSKGDVHIVYFPISVRYGTNLENIVLSSTTARLAELQGESAPQLWSIEQYRGVMLDLLRKEPQDGGRLLLVLDGLDEAAGWQPGRDLVPEVAPRHLRALFACRPFAGDSGSAGWLRRLGWDRAGVSKTMDLTGISRTGIQQVLQINACTGDVPVDEQTLDVLQSLTQGDPLLLRLYVEQMRDIAKPSGTFKPEQLQHLRPGLESFFDNWFDDQIRLWGPDRPLRERAVRTPLNICATALGPLRSSDIVHICPEEFRDRWLVEDAAERVRRFLIGDPKNEGYVFSHPRLAEYFNERLLERHEASALENLFLAYCRSTIQRLNAAEISSRRVAICSSVLRCAPQPHKIHCFRFLLHPH